MQKIKMSPPTNRRQLQQVSSLLLLGLALCLWGSNGIRASGQEEASTNGVQAEDLGPKQDRKCVPLLSSVSFQNSAGEEQTKIPASFSFAVGNIDMPIGAQQQVRPLHSAIRLLSTFESQLLGDENEGAGEGEEVVQNGEEEDGLAVREQGGNSEEATKPSAMQFRQNRLHLSGLNLTMLNVHLYNQSEPRFGLGVNIRNSTLTGRFRYSGPASALSSMVLFGAAPSGVSSARSGERSKVNGVYRISIDNVHLIANANLSKVRDETPERGEKSWPNDTLKLVTDNFKLNISNLGYISIEILDGQDPSKPTSSYVLSMLQRVLQKTIKRIYNSFESNLVQTLEMEGKRFLDCELTRFEPILSLRSPSAKSREFRQQQQQLASGQSSNMSTSLEDLSQIISSEIKNLNLSQVNLPDFDYQRQILGTNANIYFTNGSLSGLDNFRLNGETRVKMQNQHLLINASLGWFDLRPHYNWTLHLGANLQSVAGQQAGGSGAGAAVVAAPSSRGFVAFNIRAIDFDAVISKGLASNSRIIVEELTIKRLDGPKMEFGGLPGMNRLARGLVNFFMGRLKQRLVSSIQPALKRELEQILNRLPIMRQL